MMLCTLWLAGHTLHHSTSERMGVYGRRTVARVGDSSRQKQLGNNRHDVSGPRTGTAVSDTRLGGVPVKITSVRVAGRRRSRFYRSGWSFGVCALLLATFFQF